ncbi:MAG: SpoIIE family protein phosphatase, partial [Bacteroidia bacterium]|nr:SpoIIE family protein phosphatase [Bacteroidia bacterium]
PGIQVMKQIIPNLFVLFRPRDIVSGDFYWFAQKDGKTIIAAVDCTGHGVPGAFMSMVGDANLSQIVNAHGVTSPDMILNRLHIRIRQSLKQEHTQNRDGMDMTICTIDWAAGVVEFAGAKNPLVYIQNGEIHQIKGSRLPIWRRTKKKPQRIFEKHLIALRGLQPSICFPMASPTSLADPTTNAI